MLTEFLNAFVSHSHTLSFQHLRPGPLDAAVGRSAAAHCAGSTAAWAARSTAAGRRHATAHGLTVPRNS